MRQGVWFLSEINNSRKYKERKEEKRDLQINNYRFKHDVISKET